MKRTWKPKRSRRLWFPFRVKLDPPGAWSRRSRRQKRNKPEAPG